MKLISKCVFPSDLAPGEYAYPGEIRRYYVIRLDTGEFRGVVSRMFSENGNLYVDTMGGVTCRVTGDDLAYQLCCEQ